MFQLRRSLADRLFSQYIRMRAKWKCERCFTQYESPTIGLQCSHFYGRGAKSVRFDPDNAAALCTGCHQFLGAHPLEHVDFFKKRLGEKKLDLLSWRFHHPARVDEKLIAMGLKMEIKQMEESEIIYGKH